MPQRMTLKESGLGSNQEDLIVFHYLFHFKSVIDHVSFQLIARTPEATSKYALTKRARSTTSLFMYYRIHDTTRQDLYEPEVNLLKFRICAIDTNAASHLIWSLKHRNRTTVARTALDSSGHQNTPNGFQCVTTNQAV
jgi:hypothetical protein